MFDSELHVCKLYNEIINMDEQKLLSLVVGRNDIVSNIELNSENKQENNSAVNVEHNKNIININDELPLVEYQSQIKHLNCPL